MLLMIEAGIRGGICQSIHSYAKANNKYIKNYDKSIKKHKRVIVSNVFRCKQSIWMGMSQKLPVNGFKWANDLSRLNEDFIKNYSQNGDIAYFLEVVLIKIYHFYRKEKK